MNIYCIPVFILATVHLLYWPGYGNAMEIIVNVKGNQIANMEGQLEKYSQGIYDAIHFHSFRGRKVESYCKQMGMKPL